MRIRGIILLSGIVCTGLVAAACNRNTSIRDIPSVEETGTVNQELINQLNNSSQIVQGNLDQIEGNDFRLTPYVADSHFYQDTATVSWVERLGLLQFTLENSFVANDPSEGGDHFASSVDIENQIFYMKRQGISEEDICYLFLDIAVKNVGENVVEFLPGGLELFSRVEDDTYAEYGFADKAIHDISPGLIDYCGEDIYGPTGSFLIHPEETAKVRIIGVMEKKHLDQTLCIEVDGSGFQQYNEETGRYEPSTDENVKFIYIN